MPTIAIVRGNMMKKFYIIFSLLCVAGTVWYVWREDVYFYQTSFTFSPANLPIVDIEINGNCYPVGVDLGSKLSLSLNKKIINEIDKTENGVIAWRDLKGNRYQSNAYILNKIKFANIEWNNVVTNEEADDFLNNTTFWSAYDGIPRRQVGTLGRPLFLSYKVLIDVAHSRFIVSNDEDRLLEMGYDIKKMIKVPLEEGVGIILSAETDVGIQRYCIDTGATVNLARASTFSARKQGQDRGMKTYLTKKCIMGDYDFKETTFHLVDITPELKDFDGCLGMRFLKNHVVYIDYPNRTVYIAD